MGDLKKKGPNVVRAKLAPSQLLSVRLTLRDRWGSPIPDMKIVIRQEGVDLKAPGGGALVTDATGRAIIERAVASSPLEIKLDDQYLPADAEDRRGTRYVYAIEDKPDSVIELQVDDDPSGKLAMVDTQHAYATVVASVGLFRPVFRFSWQNPVHSEEAENRIYRRRVDNLRFVLRSVFSVGKAEATGLDHRGLVNKLLELFEKSQAVAAAAALAAKPPPAESTDMGTQVEPAPPSQPGPAPPTPAPEPAPPVHSEARSLPMQDVTPKAPAPEAPAPKPPPKVPDAATDGAELPRWVWYLLFHHTGLRYSPPSGQPAPNDKTTFGAHGCYVKPALFLARLRALEIEASFGANAPKPAATDITEALVLIERGKAPALHKAALLSDDTATTKKALSAIFSHVSDVEMKRLDGFRTPDNFFDGDYVALGTLKARRLKSKAVLTDEVFKQIVSRTQLRNDVQADGWEDVAQSPAELVKFFGKAQDTTQWRQRRQQTLDPIVSSSVCDQTSEAGELVRSGNVGLGIPGNAGRASTLHYLTFANTQHLRRGMHFFYTSFGLVKAGDQPYVDITDICRPRAVFAGEPDPTDSKKKLHELTPVDEVAAINDFDALLDGDDPTNKAAAAENAKRMAAHEKALESANAAGKPEPRAPLLMPRVVILPARSFSRVRFVKAALLGQAGNGNALVRCEKDPKDGKIRLHACKWTHQEMVVDVKTSAARSLVFLFSTAGGEDHGSGTGVRVYELGSSAGGQETRHLNVLFGFMHAAVGEKVGVLDACFLNPNALRMP